VLASRTPSHASAEPCIWNTHDPAEDEVRGWTASGLSLVSPKAVHSHNLVSQPAQHVAGDA
jgi:hypothetical protein